MTDDEIAKQALIAPARCCLKDIGQVGAPDDTAAYQVAEKEPIASIEEKLVEKALALLTEVSQMMRDKYRL